MDLQNYTQVDIFKKAYHKREQAESDDMIKHEHDKIGTLLKSASAAAGPVQHAQYNPYTNNYGTTIGKF